MSERDGAWLLFNLVVAACCVLSGFLPLQLIGTAVIALCMILPLAMIPAEEPHDH